VTEDDPLASAALARNGHVGPARAVAPDPPQCGGGSVAEHSVRPARQHGGHPVSFLGQRFMSHRVDTAMEHVEATAPQA
jgi:hypothetical protein